MIDLKYTDDELILIYGLAMQFSRELTELLGPGELSHVTKREDLLNELRITEGIARKTRLNLLQRGVDPGSSI